MMTADRLAEHTTTGKHDFTCRACGRWVSSGNGTWSRAKCTNRACDLFQKQQTMYAGRPAAIPLHNNDS